MPQVEVRYNAKAAHLPGLPMDKQAVLVRLGAIAGIGAASGWTLAGFEQVEGEPDAFKITLSNRLETACQAVTERIALADDPHFRLFHEPVVDTWAAPQAYALPEPVSPAPSEAYAEPEPVFTPTPPSPVPHEPALPPPASAYVPPERVFARQTQPESSASPEHASLDLRLPPVPATLVQPEAAQRRRTVIMGVVAGVVFGSAVGLLSPSASAMHQMFDPRTPAAAVPIAILCLFFWGIAQGLSRRRRVIAIESMNRPELLPAVLDGLDSHGIKGLNDAVKVDAAAHSPLLRRVRVAVEQWLLRPSMQNASLAVEQQIVADQDSTQRGYTLLRIFVWATPVLGLIGTVVGISIAVGGFAHFLSTNVDDVSKIKEGLVGVTGGLSFAFLITLEGLLTSLILMLFTSSLQTREERLYAEIDRSVAEKILPALQRICPEKDSQGNAGMPEVVTQAVDKMIEFIETVGNRFLESWYQTHTGYISDLKSFGDRVESSAQTVARAQEGSTAALVAEMAAATASQKGLAEQMQESARRDLEAYGARVSGSAETVVAALTRSTSEIGTHLNSVVNVFAEAAATQRSISQQAVADSRQALQGYQADVVRTTEAVNDLERAAKQVLESQALLQAAVASLGDSQLSGVLTRLDASIQELKPVMTNLSQPFVLQAVPVKPNHG